MTELRFIVAAFMLCASCGSQADKPTAVRKDDLKPQLSFPTPARFLNLHVPHRFSLPARKAMIPKPPALVPELQVGCEEGFVEPLQETHKNLVEKLIHQSKARRKREASGNQKRVKRRGHFRFSHTPPIQSFQFWQPQVYQLDKPYFIPIWGAPGKIPIYFPPQPLLINPGFPKDNPHRGYLPPKGYLPPETTTKGMVDLEDRIMVPDEEDNPIWDTDEEAPFNRPAATTTTQRTPTRRTRRPGVKPTPPPLIRRPDVRSNNTIVNMLFSGRPEVVPQSLLPPQRAPPPPRTTLSPSSGPSRCVWAIVSCCSATSGEVSYNCFEQLGCTGPFWDSSPCDGDFARAAIASAMRYYDTK